MAVIYNQTATEAAAGEIVACSGGTLMGGAQQQTSVCTPGGTGAGSPVTVGGSQFDAGAGQAGVMYEIIPEAGTTWAAGTWTVRLNLTTGSAAACTWTDTFICRLNSSNVNQETIGSLTGQSISIQSGQEGVKSMNVTGAAQSPSAGDKVYIVLLFNGAGANQQFNVQFNQAIDSPFTLNTDRQPGAGALALGGIEPQLLNPTTITTQVGAAAFSGLVPTFDIGTAVPVGAAALSGRTPIREEGGGTADVIAIPDVVAALIASQAGNFDIGITVPKA